MMIYHEKSFMNKRNTCQDSNSLRGVFLFTHFIKHWMKQGQTVYKSETIDG